MVAQLFTQVSMAEWFKAPDLRSGTLVGFVGSIPTTDIHIFVLFFVIKINFNGQLKQIL